MSDFERTAISRVIERAQAAGVEVPTEVSRIICGPILSHGAIAWAAAHPGQDLHCCEGTVYGDAADCTCWTPEYDVEQAPPVSGVPNVRDRMCSDCAFRPGSPERAEKYSEETLLELAVAGHPFWCHDGMRKPDRWRHPDLGTVDGSPDDWQPPIVAGVPFRADGQVALLCAGWAAHGRAAEARS